MHHASESTRAERNSTGEQRTDEVIAADGQAIIERIDVNPRIDGNRKVIVPSIRPVNQNSTGPALERDREVLSLLVRLRLLSTAELRTYLFPDRHPSIISRLLSRLHRGGWVTTWDEPAPGRGGSWRWAIPTAKSLRWASAEALGAVQGQELERLALRMLPTRTTHQLTLQKGLLPAFLAHQREVNRLCLRFRSVFQERALWVSAFDKPFPSSARGIPLPQPDFVLVLKVGKEPRLIFGEHDRGNESMAHFRETKIRRYAALRSLPSLLETLTGFTSFDVWVTVVDPITRAPKRRIARLEQLMREEHASEMYQTGLAGAVHDNPERLLQSVDSHAPSDEQRTDPSVPLRLA